jgi:hypothetical protein
VLIPLASVSWKHARFVRFIPMLVRVSAFLNEGRISCLLFMLISLSSKEREREAIFVDQWA